MLQFMTTDTLNLPFPIRNEELQTKEQKLIKNFSEINSASYLENDVRVIIKQWPLSVTSDYINTENNLTLYKGYVMPRSITMPIKNALEKSTYFTVTGYNLDALNLYLNTFILNAQRNQTVVNEDNVLLPLQTTVVSQFRIQCILSNNFIDTFCSKAFFDVVDVIPLYNLKKDYDWLKSISQSINWNPIYSTAFCDALTKYIFFSNDSGKELKDLMVTCGKKYESTIADFISFRGVQEQLARESINPTVTSSSLLNIYKLVSTQNDIYYDIAVGKNINITRINGYINYVKSLLKQPDQIPQFYFDVIAQYNNIFLSPELNKSVLLARGDKLDEYKNIIDQLNRLNQGDSIEKYDGLSRLVFNKNIFSGQQTYTWSIVTSSFSVADIFTKSYNFSDFVVQSVSDSSADTISVSGVLRFAASVWLSNNTKMSATILYENQKFIVKSVSLPTHVAIETVVNKQLLVQKMSIVEVYALIVKNSNIAQKKDVCASFQADLRLISCTKTQAVFKKNSVTYTFQYTAWESLSSYLVSDATLNTELKSKYNNTVSVASTLVDAITLVLNYTLAPVATAPVNQTPVWWALEVQVQKDFAQIWATINKTTKNTTTVTVEFLLNNTNYIAVYDNTKKEILWLGIVIDKQTYVLRNFKFSFLTATQDDLTLFSSDPKTFFLRYDPLTIRKLDF